MKALMQTAIAGLLALLFHGCEQPGGKASNGEPLVVITSNQLVPNRDGLYYNKQTKKPFTGRVDELFPFKDTRQVRVSRHFKAGKMHGLRTQYYNDGKKWIEIFYEDGKKHGLAVNWYRNGQAQWERHFKQNLLDGDFIRYDLEGNVTQHVIYKMGRVEKAIK